MERENEIKYLGVDWGRSRIGLALGSNLTKLASPYKTVSSLNDVLNIVRQEEINVIVLGEPLSLAGRKPSDSQQVSDSAIFQDFFRSLSANSGAEVELIDERLTSRLAERLSLDKKNSPSRDSISAMLILQTYLDNH